MTCCGRLWRNLGNHLTFAHGEEVVAELYEPVLPCSECGAPSAGWGYDLMGDGQAIAGRSLCAVHLAGVGMTDAATPEQPRTAAGRTLLAPPCDCGIVQVYGGLPAGVSHAAKCAANGGIPLDAILAIEAQAATPDAGLRAALEAHLTDKAAHTIGLKHYRAALAPPAGLDVERLARALAKHRPNNDRTVCSCGQAFMEVENERGERVWQSWEVHAAYAAAGEGEQA